MMDDARRASRYIFVEESGFQCIHHLVADSMAEAVREAAALVRVDLYDPEYTAVVYGVLGEHKFDVKALKLERERLLAAWEARRREDEERATLRRLKEKYEQ